MTKAKHGKMLVDGVTTMFDAWMLQDLSYMVLEWKNWTFSVCLLMPSRFLHLSFETLVKIEAILLLPLLPTKPLRKMK